MLISRPRSIAIVFLVCSLGRPLAAASLQEGPPAPAVETAAVLEIDARDPPNDGRRTNGRFLTNLGRNAVGMFSADNLRPLLVGGAVSGASAFFDDNAQRYFSEKRRAKWLGDSVDFEGRAVVIGPMAIILYGAGRLTSHHHQTFRDATYDIAQATIVNLAYMSSIKYATQRLRPDGSDNLSFPSGHVSNAFAWATVAARHYGPKFGIPAYAFAALVGVGRMEKNAHYFSDVTAGATLGYLVGRTVTRRDHEPLRGERIIGIEPLMPRGRGVGAQLAVQF